MRIGKWNVNISYSTMIAVHTHCSSYT